jgi:D-3-phosphoglycerate dehydrogenase
MKIIYTDILGKAQGYDQYQFVTFDELLGASDFISLHIPASKDGAVISGPQFDKMKNNSYIVNCARGGVVDEEALLNALDSGKLAGAALDVFAEEPSKNERIYTHEKISLTPHIGAATVEAQERIGEEIVDIITKFFE